MYNPQSHVLNPMYPGHDLILNILLCTALYIYLFSLMQLKSRWNKVPDSSTACDLFSTWRSRQDVLSVDLKHRLKYLKEEINILSNYRQL